MEKQGKGPRSAGKGSRPDNLNCHIQVWGAHTHTHVIFIKTKRRGKTLSTNWKSKISGSGLASDDNWWILNYSFIELYRLLNGFNVLYLWENILKFKSGEAWLKSESLILFRVPWGFMQIELFSQCQALHVIWLVLWSVYTSSEGHSCVYILRGSLLCSFPKQKGEPLDRFSRIGKTTLYSTIVSILIPFPRQEPFFQEDSKVCHSFCFPEK